MAIELWILETGGLVNRTNYIEEGEKSATNWQATRGARGAAQVTFYVAAGDTYQPETGWPVYIREVYSGSPASGIVFAGTIEAIEVTWRGPFGDHYVDLTLVSLDACYDTIYLKPRFYMNCKAGFIVRDLLAIAASDVPVAVGDIQDGPVIPTYTIDNQRLSDVLADLATRAGFINGVDVASQTYYFHLDTTVPAPFVLHNEQILWETMSWKKRRADFRNQQLVRMSFGAVSPSGVLFTGDGGQTDFDLIYPIHQVIQAVLTTSTQATAVGAFTDNPKSGDYITISGPPYTPSVSLDRYTFVAKLDNTMPGQVLIAASKEATCYNLIAAINNIPSGNGSLFSMPTTENGACNAEILVGATFTLRVKTPGTAGNIVGLGSVAENSPGGSPHGPLAFQWSSAYCGGGTDGLSSLLSVGVYGAGTNQDVYYTDSRTLITCAKPPDAGVGLYITFYRMGSDVIRFEDTDLVAARAAIEHGTGQYHQLLSATSDLDLNAVIQQGQKALVAYKTIPATFQFETDAPKLAPGQILDLILDSPTATPAIISATFWLINEIRAVWISGMEHTPGGGFFRYTVAVIDVTRVAGYIDFWENLAITGNFQTEQNIQTNVANQSIIGGTAGVPSSGPEAAAATGWVQEPLCGIMNGANKHFSTSWVPMSGMLPDHQIMILVHNGRVLDPFVASAGSGSTSPAGGGSVGGGEYTSYGNDVYLSFAPVHGDTLWATYFPRVSVKQDCFSASCGLAPDGQVGVDYTNTFSGAGGIEPYHFLLTDGAFPDGLTLDVNTGVLSGTPTTDGDFTFTIGVPQAGSPGTPGAPGSPGYVADCSAIGTGGLQVCCNFPTQGNVGYIYFSAIVAMGGTEPYTYAVTGGALPDGVVLDPATGYFSGTATTEGTSPFTVTVTDADSNTVSIDCSITIGGAYTGAFTAICDPPPDGLLGVPYAFSPTTTPSEFAGAATGFDLLSGALPDGLEFSGTYIMGVPLVAGTFTFEYRGLNIEGNSAPVTCSMTILPNTVATKSCTIHIAPA